MPLCSGEPGIVADQHLRSAGCVSDIPLLVEHYLNHFNEQTGKSVGGTELHGPQQRLTRMEALYHHTVGSAWFSQEEVLKGRIRPGQFADLAVLSAPYLRVDDEDLRHIESDLTVMSGRVVYGAGEFDGLASVPGAIEPDWSPVHRYGGYYSHRGANS